MIMKGEHRKTGNIYLITVSIWIHQNAFNRSIHLSVTQIFCCCCFLSTFVSFGSKSSQKTVHRFKMRRGGGGFRNECSGNISKIARLPLLGRGGKGEIASVPWGHQMFLPTRFLSYVLSIDVLLYNAVIKPIFRETPRHARALMNW